MSQGDTLELVGLIYDAVIDPQRWEAALATIVNRYQFRNAVMGVNRISGETALDVVVNVTPEQRRIIEQSGQHIVDLWGGAERAASFPLEEPAVQSRFSDPALWDSNPYFKAFAAPQGIVDNVGIALLRDRQSFATLGMGRHGSAPPIDEPLLDQLRDLTPHLVRALIISRQLGNKVREAENFAAALDRVASGVVLVDADSRVLHANHAAQAMLADGGPVRETNGKLKLIGELKPGQFHAALATVSDESRMGRQGLRIPTRDRDGTPLVASIMPLERRNVGNGAVGNAMAAVFVAGPAGEAEISPDLLDVLFELTPAEARIFSLVAAGYSNKAIANRIGIAPSTCKTHLLRIFRKTERHNRGQLIALARDLGRSGQAG